MTSITVAAIALYSAQICLVAGIAAAGAAVFPLPGARARFAYWWAVIAACAALPFVPQLFATPMAVMISAAANSAAPAARSGPETQSLVSVVVPLVLLGGVVLRATWLACGLLALRRLRASSTPATLASGLDSLAKSIAPGAEFRWHPSAMQPVTFGWRRAVVLLPQRLDGLPLDVQRAAVVHEAIHVARRDWLNLLVEQAVQAVFWFHPAMWWVVDQVQLAREQIVDEAAVTVTDARQAYLTALLSFADGFPTAALAAPFLRRRHIERRMTAIASRRTASARRVALCGICLVMTTAVSTLGAASLLPLQRDGEKGTVHRPGKDVTLPVAITQVRPNYPEDAKAERVEGNVVLDCVVTAEGGVEQVTVARSLDSRLDAAAKAALEQWRFRAGTKDGKPVAVRVQVEMTFTLK